MSSWSYSKLSDYESCPYKLVLRKQTKSTPSLAMQRGLDKHKEIENYLLGTADLPHYPTLPLEALKAANAIPEASWGLTAQWTHEPNRYNAYGICIIDAYTLTPEELRIIDFKTGKHYEIKHMDQAMVYAITGNILFPEIPNIKTEFWYLDHGAIHETLYTKDQLHHYQEILTNRVNKMLNDTTLEATPSPSKCKWCFYDHQCEYSCSSASTQLKQRN